MNLPGSREMIVLVGIQASGKSTHCLNRLGGRHTRINLDTLRTRHRERLAVLECIGEGRPFVVDNTNLTRADRRRCFELVEGATTRRGSNSSILSRRCEWF